MGFRNKKNTKPEKDNKKKKNQGNDVFGIEGEEVKSVSYFQLYRYASGKEKLMILVGILGAVLQGATMPDRIKCMGTMTNIFVSLVINTTMRKITGIKDDGILQELVSALLSKDMQTGIAGFAMNHPDIDLQKIMKSFNDSEYANSASAMQSSVTLEFKSMDVIFRDIYKFLLILAIVAVVSFIGSFIFYAFLNISALRQTTKIRSLVFNSLMRQEIAWHEKTSPGELSSRIISDTLLIEEGIGPKIGILVQNVFTFIFCFILAFTSGFKLTLYMAVILPALILVGGTMGTILSKYTKKTQDAYGVIGGIAQEAFSQIRTIASFGNEQKEIDRYVEKLKPTKRYGIIKAQTFGFCFGLIFGIIYCSYSIAFYFGSKFIHKGEMVGGDVLQVFMGVMMGAMSISSCGHILNSFGEASGAAAKLFYIIERKPKINAEVGECPEAPVNGEIEFRNVRFTYPARPDIEILKGISFRCQPGQTVALVGASGSGKSTIVQLLERYYEKSEGEILIDGKPVEDYNIHWLRTQIGLVSQEPTLFDATIAENIAITCPDATQEQIEAAAKLANAHEFIQKLPNGYQTSTGERGLQLSGGQKQRICIARALMMNPKILLLDEATSALDNQSEKVVQAALDSASSGRSTLVIAHRLTTVKNADCIIVMDKGVIIESGTHNELMEKQGVYYNLVKNQEMNVQENEVVEDEESDVEDSEMKKITIAEEEGKEEAELLNKRETTTLSRILTNISTASFNRRNTTRTSVKSGEQQKPITGGSLLASMDWKRYLSYNKPVWWANLLGMIGAIFNGSIQPAFAFIFASAMNVFNKQGQELLDDGKFWALMFILLGVANVISFYCQIGGFSTAGEYLSYTFRKEMYNSMIRQEVGFFDCSDIGSGKESAGGGGPGGATTSTGTLTAKLATEAGLVQGLNINVGSVLEIIVTIVVGFTIAFCNGWKLTLILLVAVPFLFVGTFLQMSSNKNKNEEKRRVLEGSTKVSVEAIVAIKTVYALNLEERFCKLYEEKLIEPEKRLVKKYYISSVGTGFSNAVAFFAYILGFYAGALFIKNGELEFQNMFRVLMAIIFTAMAVGRASSIAPDYDKAAEAFGHVLEIIDRKSKIDASDPSGIKQEPFKGNISFNNLRFRYPSRPNITVLRLGDGKIEIPEGKMLALVGGSGCGKSTIIGLLPRWYDAQHGEVIVDGKKNSEYNLKWFREHIGVVNQEPSLFNISIKDNIRYGKEDATDEEIIEAAKKANIHDFIMSLPEGYDTLVGGLGTSRMSGGQKQRVAIARAMVRNPKVLLLDEATSALDAESELIVQQALEEASQGRTTITIAHRLSTIKNSDVIVVMKEGRIVEQGNHEELMAKKGEYYEMVLAGDGGVHKQ
ncbi:multidrug resistance protein 1 [Piromyces finnis]|uniref:Multidrug resistance protein 1 n=1 Tax=Piromyces finnis TaxID=1754191 RepID=A0A1Y1V249_9FUNG|nr:multidrug resistance protein 1 [Piromyces finnis]|eukprot:ORX45556.1 multidrug resistance protein 1 [Piromyces finnis]